MGRRKATTPSLDTLIPQYAENKSLMEDYKKLCDEENKQIKELMSEGSYSAGGYKATKSIQHRQSMNEEKLLDLLRQYPIEKDIIKTKEYVDMDALESAIYRGDIDKELLMKIDKCRETKEVVVLKVTKEKK